MTVCLFSVDRDTVANSKFALEFTLIFAKEEVKFRTAEKNAVLFWCAIRFAQIPSLARNPFDLLYNFILLLKVSS